MNFTQLAAALEVSRQTLHRWRVKDPEFPAPQRQPGSTRDLWDLEAGRRYWAGRDTRQGERTDLKEPLVADKSDPSPEMPQPSSEPEH